MRALPPPSDAQRVRSTLGCSSRLSHVTFITAAWMLPTVLLGFPVEVPDLPVLLKLGVC